MTRWFSILILTLLILTPCILWAHGGHEHVLGTVTESTADHIVVTTPKGESVSILIGSETSFQQNGVETKDSRPQVGDRLVAEVRKDGGKFLAEDIRFATPKSKKAEK
ncbi:MAG: hypothetical protein MRJ96_10195 [Nitrospirales bacterium]|nr:hypothetical protein [Nitrospira sp.]MDR4501808.1 hypothetical protein [Nitrospirales bacterium]